MKKYIGFIGVVIINCILITGLLVHAFTLDSVKDSENDNKKQYVYIEKTTVKEEEDPEIDSIQENVNKSNKANSSELNNNNYDNKKEYIKKTTTVKSTYSNNTTNNAINDNTNNSSNKNDNSNSNNNNYIVEYTNTSYCGFCGKQLNNNNGICEDCREIRSKLGE